MSESKAGVEAIRIHMIRLYEPWTECRLCGADTPSRWGVPMYEGNLLSNNFKGEWFAAPACQSCHDLHAMGELRTFDHLYAYAARPLFEELLLSETSRVLRLVSMGALSAPGRSEEMNMLNEYTEIIVGGAYCAGYMHGRRAAELAFESYAYHAITVSPVVSAYLWTLTLHSNRYSDAIKEASLILQSNQEEVKEQEACKATPNTLPVFEVWDLDEEPPCGVLKLEALDYHWAAKGYAAERCIDRPMCVAVRLEDTTRYFSVVPSVEYEVSSVQ